MSYTTEERQVPLDRWNLNTGSSRHFFFFHKHRTPALVIAFLQLKSPSLSNCWTNVTSARVRRWWNMYLTSFHCINFYQISEIVIFYASVKINDAETDTCMCITLSFNTCTIKPLGIINELFIPFFSPDMEFLIRIHPSLKDSRITTGEVSGEYICAFIVPQGYEPVWLILSYQC